VKLCENSVKLCVTTYPSVKLCENSVKLCVTTYPSVKPFGSTLYTSTNSQI
jgi:hypothetical protein